MASSSALITFRVTLPKEARIVRVLGSWDNFKVPYSLKLDRLVSRTTWRGCHTFSNIVCDGETITKSEDARNGALREGATYWYYYQLDDEEEYVDAANPSTRSCPLLPGQEVNILEVPYEYNHRRSSGDFISSSCFTLDPAAKFLTPGTTEMATTKSKRPDALSPTLSTKPIDINRWSASAHSNTAKFFSSRPTRTPSFDEECDYSQSYPDKRQKHRHLTRPKTSLQGGETAWWTAFAAPRNIWSAGDAHDLYAEPLRKEAALPVAQLPAEAQRLMHQPLAVSHSMSVEELPPALKALPSTKNVAERTGAQASRAMPPAPVSTTAAEGCSNLTSHPTSKPSSMTIDKLKTSLVGLCLNNTTQHESPPTKEDNTPILNSVRSSFVMPSSFSVKSSNGGTFSSYLSQPLTPVFSDFGEPFSLKDFSFTDGGADSSQGEPSLHPLAESYTQPALENCSVLTFKTLQALPEMTTKQAPSDPSPVEQQKSRIHEWSAAVPPNDNQTAQDTGPSMLSELCDELGYLGSLIQ